MDLLVSSLDSYLIRIVRFILKISPPCTLHTNIMNIKLSLSICLFIRYASTAKRLYRFQNLVRIYQAASIPRLIVRTN